MNKLLLVIFCLLSTAVSAQVTAHKFVVDEISNLHGGDEVMEIMSGAVNFVGFKIPLGKGLGNFMDSLTADNVNQFYFRASHNYFGKYDDDYKKCPHFKDKKVKKVVKKLKNKCQRFAKKLNKMDGPHNEEYYCSKVFVYTGDVNNPDVEGSSIHKAEGQSHFTRQKQKPGTASLSRTRLSLPSNNELMGDYEVYTIGLMRK